MNTQQAFTECDCGIDVWVLLCPAPTPVHSFIRQIFIKHHCPGGVAQGEENLHHRIQGHLLEEQDKQVGLQKIPWRRAWQPTPIFLPGESHGQRSLAGYSPWNR